MKKVIIFFFVFFLSPLPLIAQVYIVEVMPNTIDDANLEYIDIQNTGCTSIDISGYQIADKVKLYTFAVGSTLASHEIYRLRRPTSRIELNNSNEELSLRDAGGAIVNNFTYTASVKGTPIIVPGITLDTCETGDGGDANEEESDSSEDTGSDEVEGDESLGESEEDGHNTQGDTGEGEGDAGTGDTDEGVEETSTGITEENEPQEDANIDEDIENIGEDTTNSGILESDDGADAVPPEEGEDDIQTSDLLGKSGSLAPQILLYSDSDGDNRIDMLEVLYDVYITGSVDISKILLYSNTGGLYETRVNTATGYILDAEIEDNILRLHIEPSHFEKSTLIHNATTQSDIRLKSSGGFGVMSLTGILIEDFLLTSSFDAYKEVYEKSTYESLGKEVGQSGESTGGTSSGMILPVAFPEIVPTIQNYSNTTLSGSSFVCRETPCRLNLNFESIFNATYPASVYSCRVTYNGITEDKCNPSQWNPTSALGVDVRIIHKATGQYQSRYFPIEWNIISNPANPTPSVHDRAAPIPHITLNGTLTKKQILIGDNHIYCYTNTCSVNFDGSGTYDPDNSSMTYSWSLSGKVFATKKNPTTQEFGIGEHTVEFTVTDSSGKSSREYYKVSVLGEMIVPPDSEIAIASDTRSKKSKKKQVIRFFSPPELIVEKASDGFSKSDDGYRCITTSASCSANFSLTGTTTGVYYRFSYAHEPASFWSSNPRSKSFQAGKYLLIVSAHYEKDAESIWQQSIPIEIFRIKKAKTVKTPTKKVSQEKVVSSKNIDIIPTAYAEDGTGSDGESTLTLSILFLSMLLNVFFLRRKIPKIV